MAFKHAPLSHESSLPQTGEIRLINGLLEPEEAKFLHKDFTELNFIPYPGVKSQIIDLNNFLDQLESKNRIKSSQTVQKLAHIANKRVIGLSHIVVDTSLI